jgi:hypothetical protein
MALRSPLLFLALLIIPVGCGVTQGAGSAAQNDGAPGFTGRTTVIGSNSSVAGDQEATSQQQKWPIQPRR